MDALIETALPFKTVVRHSNDTPWVTDGFRDLIRKRQRAYKAGDMASYRRLRNKANRDAAGLRHEFYRSNVASLHHNG